MNNPSASVTSSMTRLLVPLVGFAAMVGFSPAAEAVPPPPPASAPPASAPVDVAPPPDAPDAATPPPPISPLLQPPPSLEGQPTNPQGGASLVPLSWQPNNRNIAPMWPTRIDYEEGDVVVPGYDIKTRYNRNLVVGGLVTFLIPYSLSFLVGGAVALEGNDNDKEEFAPLLVPVIGPFISLGVRENGNFSRSDKTYEFFMLANGFIQAAGAAMITAGILMPEKYLERMATLPGKPQVFVGAGSATVRLQF